ncbi:MAG TPA: diguanylate cyclase [Rhodocyclaceae bacterium]
MPREAIAKLWLRAWSMILVEMTAEEVVWLFWPGGHLSLLSNRRSAIIVTRVRLLAGLFAILTPLWIIIDMAVFPAEVWRGLAGARVAASLAFGAVLAATQRTAGLGGAYKGLAFLLTIPAAFFLYSYEHMAQFTLNGLPGAIATGYGFLPFVMLAGLSIFPLTLAESLVFSLPMLLMPVIATMLTTPHLDLPLISMTIWLSLLIVGVAALAGLSQLAFMIVFIREAIRDNMTGCFTRHSGEELLDLQFVLATRVNAPLALAFVDIDHFKRINDNFGHEAGDMVLKGAAAQLRKHLRAGDMLTRWGGEEFLLIMPNTTAQHAHQALMRVCESGLGLTPDQQRVTASIGIAERQLDHASDWAGLVAKADARMYQAKQTGRNRLVGLDCALTPQA